MLQRMLNRFGASSIYVVSGRILQFLLFWVLAQETSVEVMGVFITSLTISQLIATFSTFGLGAASQKIIPEAVALRRPARVSGFIRCLLFVLLSSTAIIIMLVVLVRFLGHYFGININSSNAFGLILFIPAVSISINRELLSRAFGSIGLAFLPRDILWSACVIALVILLQPSDIDILWIGGLSLLLIETGAIFVLYRRHLSVYQIFQRSRIGFRRRWVSDGISFVASSLGGQGFERIDMLYVAATMSIGSAGVYGLCSRLAPSASICQRFIVPVLLNRFSGALARHERTALEQDLLSGLLASVIFTFPIILLAGIFGENILSLFGGEYVNGGSVLFALVLAHSSVAIGSNFGALLLSSNKNFLYGAVVLGVMGMTIFALFIIRPNDLKSVAWIICSGIISYNIILTALSLKYLTDMPYPGQSN